MQYYFKPTAVRINLFQYKVTEMRASSHRSFHFSSCWHFRLVTHVLSPSLWPLLSSYGSKAATGFAGQQEPSGCQGTRCCWCHIWRGTRRGHMSLTREPGRGRCHWRFSGCFSRCFVSLSNVALKQIASYSFLCPLTYTLTVFPNTVFTFPESKLPLR